MQLNSLHMWAIWWRYPEELSLQVKNPSHRRFLRWMNLSDVRYVSIVYSSHSLDWRIWLDIFLSDGMARWLSKALYAYCGGVEAWSRSVRRLTGETEKEP